MSWGMARRSAVPAVGDICRDDIEDYKVLLAARSAATLYDRNQGPVEDHVRAAEGAATQLPQHHTLGCPNRTAVIAMARSYARGQR